MPGMDASYLENEYLTYLPYNLSNKLSKTWKCHFYYCSVFLFTGNGVPTPFTTAVPARVGEG